MEQIDKPTLDFLTKLKKNNDRNWFNQNRTLYEDARKNFGSFIQEVIAKITDFDPILKGLEASSCIFRINRDIRFSNDKTIYKSHLGAFIVRGGKKNGDKYAGYYVHVEPGNNSMIAGGAYMPPMPWLTAIREKIDQEGKKFLEIINHRDFIKHFGKIEGEKLKSAPKGFQKDHPMIELLKLKSYLVVKMISDKEVVGNECFDDIIRISKAMKPINDFLNEY